jgi:hypothetical protein
MTGAITIGMLTSGPRSLVHTSVIAPAVVATTSVDSPAGVMLPSRHARPGEPNREPIANTCAVPRSSPGGDGFAPPACVAVTVTTSTAMSAGVLSRPSSSIATTESWWRPGVRSARSKVLAVPGSSTSIVVPPADDGVVPPADDGVVPPADDGVVPPADDGVVPVTVPAGFVAFAQRARYRAMPCIGAHASRTGAALPANATNVRVPFAIAGCGGGLVVGVAVTDDAASTTTKPQRTP